ncbi:hypothetical protein NBO_1439g0001 [Nosema bombycis CQ1]|uniref:Uncharacterized protein n=1 Tax=Nosema bombycis (strain CQ1 / CVCC 102059) TaxID=578461 RepID=R0MEJ9_NOSB1|nr:hypothetical protein NBO_1439g0001 [Nosema bombycis CQ1]|eukprot:EOB11208.1 hypothetical protein NBO_1439g0001 [Nosema bombycis CQ1]
MNESLLKYKKAKYFTTYLTFEQYLNHQMPHYAQDEDFIFIKKMFENSQLTPDIAIAKMAKCRITSLPFYTNYLFFNYKTQSIEVLVKRFNEEQALENKIVIYNCIRLLISHFELIEMLKLLDQEILSILIGEYGKSKGLSIEDLGLANFHYKFLGYFTMEEIENMSLAELKMYIKKDINVMKIFTMCSANHFNLKEILNEDIYLRFYLENCIINMDLLKNLKIIYNPYILFLLFDKLRDDESFCKKRINELSPIERTSLFILFARDDKWLAKYSTEELPSFNFQPKNEHQVLRLINHIGKKFFHFSAVQQLHKSMPKDKKDDLKEIDNFLFEKSMPKILEKCLEEGMRVNISNWMSSKEIYFSLVVEKVPWLNDFHKSDKKKRSQLAEDILVSRESYIFLDYLEKRKVIVDFREKGEIVHDFSIEWLKMFVEENLERIKKIAGDEYISTIITYLNDDDRDILLIVNKEKQKILDQIFKNLTVNNLNNGNNEIEKTKRIKNSEELCPDEEYLATIYDDSYSENSMFGCFENKTITEFKKPGVLNKFILSHLHDIEGCAKIVADLVMYIYEIENFLRKIVFMIEDENLLSTFIYHFLRLSYSTFPLGPIRRWIDSIGPVLLAAKVREYDLGTLIDNYYSDDLLAGILLRGYSYYLWDPDYEKKFEEIKDGDITFYYENNFKFGVKIKCQLEKINYDYIRKEDFLMEMVMFANSNCPKRKEVVLRCLNVLGFDFYHKYLKENEGKISELIIENPIGNFHLLHKLVDIYFDPNKSTVYKLIDLLIHGPR